MTILQALFSFEGRLSRRDYWLKGFLVLLPFSIINNILFCYAENDATSVLVMVTSIFSLWPGLALSIKRLHDRNKSGTYLLWILLPVINIIFSFWILFQIWFLRGTVGSNNYGDDPA